MNRLFALSAAGLFRFLRLYTGNLNTHGCKNLFEVNSHLLGGLALNGSGVKYVLAWFTTVSGMKWVLKK